MGSPLCKKGGVRYRNQYQLRHTYASWMITHANVNVSYLAQQMSHADITMVARVYGKWLVESNKKESERVWQELEKVRNQSPPKGGFLIISKGISRLYLTKQVGTRTNVCSKLS